MLSSPRTWGCFCFVDSLFGQVSVFPTHVGVFLNQGYPFLLPFRLPHARGGVSSRAHPCKVLLLSSPRTWGCFPFDLGKGHRSPVFPTHVGVFPRHCTMPDKSVGLPRARGGVSSSVLSALSFTTSSPRTWGCFQFASGDVNHQRVFPTHVGVFLLQRRSKDWTVRLPHARGGVSMPGTVTRLRPVSSPRTWGCFQYAAFQASQQAVFPTHVGVFLRGVCSILNRLSLPHARGGVSQTADTVGFRPLSSLRTWGISKKLLIAVY